MHFCFIASQEQVPIRPTSFPTDDLNLRRKNAVLSRQNSRQSVKSLIESIESQGKPVSKSCKLYFISSLSTLVTQIIFNLVSRSSSASSLNSLASDIRNPSSPSILPTPSPGSPLRTPSDWTDISSSVGQIKTPLKEQQPNKITGWSKNGLNGTIVV